MTLPLHAYYPPPSPDCSCCLPTRTATLPALLQDCPVHATTTNMPSCPHAFRRYACHLVVQFGQGCGQPTSSLPFHGPSGWIGRVCHGTPSSPPGRFVITYYGVLPSHTPFFFLLVSGPGFLFLPPDRQDSTSLDASAAAALYLGTMPPIFLPQPSPQQLLYCGLLPGVYLPHTLVWRRRNTPSVLIYYLTYYLILFLFLFTPIYLFYTPNLYIYYVILPDTQFDCLLHTDYSVIPRLCIYVLPWTFTFIAIVMCMWLLLFPSPYIYLYIILPSILIVTHTILYLIYFPFILLPMCD